MKKKTKTPRTGRPKLAETRNLYITGVRVSRSELDQLRQRAKQAGKSVSAYVRHKLDMPDTGYGKKS